MKAMYFRLNPECYLIRGEKLGAIYDLIDMKIYILNQQETEMVTSCEKNNFAKGDETLLHTLKQFCLGNFYNNIVYINNIYTRARTGTGTRGIIKKKIKGK